MSRKSPRIRARLAVTVHVHQGKGGADDVLICRTRDISSEGCFLDTVQTAPRGSQLSMTFMDEARGEVIQMEGVVARCVPGGDNGAVRGIGVRIANPTDEWALLVSRRHQHRLATQPEMQPIRLRVLVVGDPARRRGALALYVTSGWDVRFASDLNSAEEALVQSPIDAVVAEHDIDDDRWRTLMRTAGKLQPKARRIVRSALPEGWDPDTADGRSLCDRMVDRDAGLDALMDALTADFSAPADPAAESGTGGVNEG